MASRTLYTYRRFDVTPEGAAPALKEVGEPLMAVPAITWSDGGPWLEACVYLAERAITKHADGGSLAVVQAESWHLRAYAEFLEARSLSWREFPAQAADRPTKQFRGHQIGQRRAQILSPSTIKTRMSVVRRFYEWALIKKLLDDGAIPYTPKNVKVTYRDQVGLVRSVSVTSSDLSIPYRAAVMDGVEDGLFPLTLAQRDGLIRLSRDSVHTEFRLMLLLGFFSGMRIGTIIGLTHSALRKARPSQDIFGWQSVAVGPQAGIPTKGDVDYFPSMPPGLLTELREYGRSLRAIERRERAAPDDRDLLFLKRDGGRYTNITTREEIARLRRAGNAWGLGVGRFKFHCSRATFGTSVVVAYLRYSDLHADQIMRKLMALMGHKTIQSSLRYLKFVERAEADEQLTENYAALLLGEGLYER